MKNIERLRETARSRGLELSDVVRAPRSDPGKAARFREICATDRCGNHGRSWTCPPAVGTVDECLERMHSYDRAVIYRMSFDGVDMNDGERLKDMADQHQNACREIMRMFREEGFDVLALADGACNHCDECTCPGDPCRSPDQRVPSVSGFGIDMGEYITQIGMDFRFGGDSVTFYGLILFR